MSEQLCDSSYIAWVDLETTGLDPENEVILEIAVIVTDGHLRVKRIGPSVVIRCGDWRLRQMDEFVQQMHTHNGLWKECVDTGTTVEDAEKQVLQFLENIAPAGSVPLGGSTISFDRAFLAKHMPQLHDWFHYRNVDVTSFKEMWKRWLPEAADRMPPKQEAHRAQADIIESIEALRFFHDEVMKTSV